MKKRTNTILLTVFLALLTAFVLTKTFRSPSRESNLNAEVLRVDTAKLEMIRVSLPAGSKELVLTRNDSSWTVRQEQKTANVGNHNLDNLLRLLNDVKAERMVSRTQSRWGDYEVGDSSAIRMEAFTSGEEEIAGWLIGKQSAGLTYVRPAGQDEVYAVEGNLRAHFEKDFNDWRDKLFLRMDKAFISKVRFGYPSDSSFTVEKKDNTWMIGNEKADSASIDSYLNKMQSKDLSGFADDFTPDGPPDVTVEYFSNEVPHAVVKAWRGPENNWILHSSLQEGVYFRDAAFSAELFPAKKELLAGG